MLKLLQSMIAPWFVFMIVWSPHVVPMTPDDLIRSAGSSASTAGSETFEMEENTKKWRKLFVRQDFLKKFLVFRIFFHSSRWK